MLASVKGLFTPPTLEDPARTIQARNLHTILLVTMVLAGAYLLYSLTSDIIAQALAPLLLIILEFGLLILLRVGRMGLASALFSSLVWLAVLSEVVIYGGIRDSGFASFAIVVVIAGLTMGIRGGIIFTLLTILAGTVLVFLEQQALLPPLAQVSAGSVLLSHSITFTAVTLLLYLVIHSVTSASRRAQAGEQAQREANELLRQSQADLEQRSASLEQRNAALQTLADISRLIGQSRNQAELLEQSARLIAARLGAEHVALFLLDETEDNAVLIAASGSEAKALLAKGHKLNVIRSEFAFAMPGTELLHYFIMDRNYYLERPATVTGMDTNLSFAMTGGERLVGLLNLQSSAGGAIAIDRQAVQTIADQIALSVANLRLLVQLQNRIQEIDALAGQAVSTAWSRLRGGEAIGYQYDRLQILPAGEDFPSEVTKELLTGRPISYLTQDASPRSRLVAPILLRENVIGVIGYEDNDPGHAWQPDEMALLSTVASRVSLAVENARLVAEAQQRAERERVISQVTSKMRETLDLETILKTAVREMRQSLDLDEAEVRLQFVEQARKPGKERS
jgi:GAF domain-containing protein